jgi:hypothetical protein
MCSLKAARIRVGRSMRKTQCFLLLMLEAGRQVEEVRMRCCSRVVAATIVPLLRRHLLPKRPLAALKMIAHRRLRLVVVVVVDERTRPKGSRRGL